jgi:hypothetical protein
VYSLSAIFPHIGLDWKNLSLATTVAIDYLQKIIFQKTLKVNKIAAKMVTRRSLEAQSKVLLRYFGDRLS